MSVSKRLFEIKELLKAGRRYLRKKEHWCKRLMEDGDRSCAIGAIYRLKKDPSIYYFGISYLHHALPKHSNRKKEASVSIALFNDSPKTSHRSILNLYTRAIKKCEVDIAQQEKENAKHLD